MREFTAFLLTHLECLKIPGKVRVPNLGLAPKPLVHSVQDVVLYNVLVDLLSNPDRCKLGDHRRQTQGGVVCQRHVTNLHQKEGWRGGESAGNENPLKLWILVWTAYWYHTSAHLKGVEAVVYEGADVVQIQSGHVFDSPGGILESRQTYVKVDLIQVSTVKCIKLEKESRKQ